MWLRFWGIAFAAIVGVTAILGFDPFGIRGLRFMQSAEDHSVYFRLLAKYQHGDETIDFDVVAGCGVRVTRYGDGDKSYDASRDPVIFGKRTRDGGAVWQIMPAACLGETTENGEVPVDFLPGAIWFDNVSDFSFGTAYVTEDAFQNPAAKLKFLGASIHKATRQDWEAFQPIASANLVDSRPFNRGNPRMDEKQVLANLWNKDAIAKWRPAITCNLVERYRFRDARVHSVIREYWPASRPRYWAPPKDQLGDIAKRIGSFRTGQILSLGVHISDGFPTRAGGGTLHSGHGSALYPPTIFPLRADEGLPWLNESLAQASVIYRDVDIDGGRNLGLAYCYSSLRSQDNISKLHIPDYFQRLFQTRVDGELVHEAPEDMRGKADDPGIFFERDEYFYIRREFGFS